MFELGLLWSLGNLNYGGLSGLFAVRSIAKYLALGLPGLGLNVVLGESSS